MDADEKEQLVARIAEDYKREFGVAVEMTITKLKEEIASLKSGLRRSQHALESEQRQKRTLHARVYRIAGQFTVEKEINVQIAERLAIMQSSSGEYQHELLNEKVRTRILQARVYRVAAQFSLEKETTKQNEERINIDKSTLERIRNELESERRLTKILLSHAEELRSKVKHQELVNQQSAEQLETVSSSLDRSRKELESEKKRTQVVQARVLRLAGRLTFEKEIKSGSTEQLENVKSDLKSAHHELESEKERSRILQSHVDRLASQVELEKKANQHNIQQLKSIGDIISKTEHPHTTAEPELLPPVDSALQGTDRSEPVHFPTSPASPEAPANTSTRRTAPAKRQRSISAEPPAHSTVSTRSETRSSTSRSPTRIFQMSNAAGARKSKKPKKTVTPDRERAGSASGTSLTARTPTSTQTITEHSAPKSSNGSSAIGQRMSCRLQAVKAPSDEPQVNPVVISVSEQPWYVWIDDSGRLQTEVDVDSLAWSALETVFDQRLRKYGHMNGFPVDDLDGCACAMRPRGRQVSWTRIGPGDYTCKTCYNARELCTSYSEERGRFEVLRLPTEEGKVDTINMSAFIRGEGTMGTSSMTSTWRRR